MTSSVESTDSRPAGTQERAGRRALLVDFLGIGVQKAGTTWLHQMLGAHPDIFIARGDDKDLRFFSSYYDFGYRWYERFFIAGDLAKRRGEFSTSYFYCKDAPGRVYRYNPEMRLVLSLRNPVDRLISHHGHEIRIGNITEDLSLEQGIENNPSYVEQSMYFTQLSRWLEYFPLSSLHVVIFEELFRDPATAIRDLYSFLGVSSAFVPEQLGDKVNEGRIPRSWIVDRSVKIAASSLRGLRLGWVVDRFKKAGLKKAIARRNTRSDEAMEIDEALRRQLRSVFAEENAKLARLLARDLAIWTAQDTPRG